jgi:2-polyprenyl-3-methyl-5-hydroxy-6-metoxy-1,4-benzoquinol methylase
MSSETRHQQFLRESQFHDEWARSTGVEDVSVEQYARGPTALENRFFLARLGDLHGKRLLDIGCGLGESSVMFALEGAQVTATDISPEMVAFTAKLAKKYKIPLETMVGAAEELSIAPASFDIIYTANTIHHLADKQAFLDHIIRWLTPDGLFCSWDPVKYNPIINIYRTIATKVRTEDEAPVGISDLKLLKNMFAKVEHHHFWFLALALFLKYYLVDRVSPNEQRYWKRIYQECDSTLGWWKPLEQIDRILLKLPAIRWLSWNVAFVAQK